MAGGGKTHEAARRARSVEERHALPEWDDAVPFAMHDQNRNAHLADQVAGAELVLHEQRDWRERIAPLGHLGG